MLVFISAYFCQLSGPAWQLFCGDPITEILNSALLDVSAARG